MSLPVRIRAEANAELNAAWNWYENQREGLGEDLLGCVDPSFAAVGRAPEGYPRIDGPIRRALVRGGSERMLMLPAAYSGRMGAEVR